MPGGGARRGGLGVGVLEERPLGPGGKREASGVKRGCREAGGGGYRDA
jgi:hypothetical protein